MHSDCNDTTGRIRITASAMCALAAFAVTRNGGAAVGRFIESGDLDVVAFEQDRDRGFQDTFGGKCDGGRRGSVGGDLAGGRRSDQRGARRASPPPAATARMTAQRANEPPVNTHNLSF